VFFLPYSTLRPPERVVLLDEIRGFCLLLMILYHGAFDIIYIFGFDIPAFHWPVLRVAQPLVAGVFILISGICCHYSRSNLRRGALALGVGVLMSLITWRIMPDMRILFGILHFLGATMMLFALARQALDRLPVFWGLFVMAALFAFTLLVPQGRLGLPGPFGINLPRALYRTPFLFPLGFPSPGFFSSDYFPLIPWLFCFFAGSYLGVLSTQGGLPRFFYHSHARPLAAMGRRSLIIYVLHQPVLYGLLTAVLHLCFNG